MNNMVSARLLATAVATSLLICACGGGGGSSRTATPTPAPSAIQLTGEVQDGPVSGGTILVFSAHEIADALAAAENAEDRVAALAGELPIAQLVRDPDDGATYQIQISGLYDGIALFLVFDNGGAEDLTFGDTPFNMESVVIGDNSSPTQRANITPHTTLIAQLVREALDPDGNGVPLDNDEIDAEIASATDMVVSAFGEDDEGESLELEEANPMESEDSEQLEHASTYLGLLVRTASTRSGLDADDVVEALSADAADGVFDGTIPASAGADTELEAAAADVADASVALDLADQGGTGACSESARSLRQACAYDAQDDYFTASATCVSAGDDEECLADVELDLAETNEECDEIFEARLDLCDDLDDEAYAPDFGEDFAANFVNPLLIGDTIEPNPYVPLIPGAWWVYEGADATVTVTVTEKTKLIDGVTCIVVTDVESEEDVVIEETDDWFAQDMDGNVWYCGEISKEYELFDGDDPEEPELVGIEGSWKAGRDGALAGILMPAEPEIEEVIRQEVAWTDAEDAIEIVSLTGSETATAATCDGTCLVTSDFSPLEPDAEENKYYAPGIGLILEVNLEDEERVELVEYSIPQ